MTKNPVLESASKILLDYVEDTETFATAINESVGSLALLDGQCNFLREPTPHGIRVRKGDAAREWCCATSGGIRRGRRGADAAHGKSILRVCRGGDVA